MLRHGGLIVAFLALATLPMRSRADQITLVPDGVGSWQNAPSSLNPGPGGGGTLKGTPFWNNASTDGTAANVGYFLTGTGYFSNHANYPYSPKISLNHLQYWGTSKGNADPVEQFTSGGSGVQTELLVQVAANSNENQLWYQDSTGLHELYNPATDGSGKVVAFDPVGNFTFVMINPNDHYEFDSNSYSNLTSGDSKGNQHFAVFQSSTGGPMYIGVEDSPLNMSSTDGDYNDMVFSLQAVPEPASAALLAIGAAGLAGCTWRRRRKRLAA